MPPPRLNWAGIAAAHPKLRVETVQFLGEGWSSHAFLVSDSFVFRFPKREDVWCELEREIAFLAVAADALSLEVPRYLGVNRSSLHAAHGYAVYSYIAGSSLSLADLSGTEREAAADAIAAFLRSLHDATASAITGAPLQKVDAHGDAVDLWELAERRVCPLLTTDERTLLREVFRWYMDTPASSLSSTTVIHGDFGSDHVLTSNGRVSGVIDFADVAVGDPDCDFASLFVDVGTDFTLDLARRYGHTSEEQLACKLRYFALADQIDTIVNGDGLALSGQRETAWQRLRHHLSQGVRP